MFQAGPYTHPQMHQSSCNLAAELVPSPPSKTMREGAAAVGGEAPALLHRSRQNIVVLATRGSVAVEAPPI